MKKDKIDKTNASRILDRAKVKYELVPYEVDESDLSAVHVAQQLGEPIERVYKTLVLLGDKIGHFVCVIPGEKELDLKQTARISGNKSCAMVHMKELLDLTGYIRGGCCPLGMKKQFPTFFDSSCLEFDYIYISAGKRGLQIKADPVELIKAAGAKAEQIIVD